MLFRSRSASASARAGFTLVELLVAIAIIGMLTALALGGLYQARTKTQANRTRQVVHRLDAAITPRWESYRTRRLALDIRTAAMYRLKQLGASDDEAYYGIRNSRTDATGATVFLGQRAIAETRLVALRETMRLEMPHRYEDITSDLSAWPNCPAPLTEVHGLPAITITPSGVGSVVLSTPGLPGLNAMYLRRINNNRDHDGNPIAPTDQHQNAECLYLIVTLAAIDQETTAADYFRHEDVGDADDDGMPEFHDSWGNPIAWLRWPAGYVSFRQPQPTGDALEWAVAHPDPFDPAGIDRPVMGATEYRGYRIEPLIYSSGLDGVFDIVAWMSGMTGPQLNDPYFTQMAGGEQLGLVKDYDSDGRNDLDNVTSHDGAGQQQH